MARVAMELETEPVVTELGLGTEPAEMEPETEQVELGTEPAEMEPETEPVAMEAATSLSSRIS
jgi:hypothetical protein